MAGTPQTAPDEEPIRSRRLTEALRSFGASEEEIEHALLSGEPQRAVLETMIRRSSADRTVSVAEIEARGGPPAENLSELMGSFGLPMPAPREPAFTAAEAEALIGLWERREAWPFELSIQLGRVYGRLLARIAHSSVQLWVSVLEPELRQYADEPDQMLTRASALEGLLPVADMLLATVHRRWLEREFAQVAFGAVPLTPGTASGTPTAVEVSFLFCDLKDFTAFADRVGDTAAVAMIDQFAAVVTRERGPEARLTKLLGDGFMCAYPSPQLAVEAGARIIAGMAQVRDDPGVHASVHHGLAIPREGDYFGAAVNLTARLLGRAGRDELLATRAAVDGCHDVDWEPVGTLQVRGMSREVEIFRLRR